MIKDVKILNISFMKAFEGNTVSIENKGRIDIDRKL